jgi:hypothetical protein
MMGARVFLTSAGTCSGRVMMALSSARPHLQPLAAGRRPTVSAMIVCAADAF